MRRYSRPLLLTTILWLGCHSEHPEHHAEGKLPVTNPHRSDTELTREYVAQIQSIQHIELRAMSRGYVQGIFVDEGKPVAKGAKMFQIMPAIYSAEVQKAQAEVSVEEIEVRNAELLVDKGVVSPNELALAKAKLARARAEVSAATTHWSLTQVRAPFDGIMGRFNVRMGSLVDEGELLTTLSDNHTVWAYFNVSEAEYLRYRTQPEGMPQTVRLMMANGQIFDEVGKVETIEADFNNETGAIAFRATFPNPKGLLRHGETGKVLMPVPMKNALLIPQRATFDILDKKFVYVVDEHDVVHSRPIKVGAETTQVYVVESGLDEHDKVLIDGLRKVKDGVKIETEFRPPPEVLSHLEVPAE